MTHAQSEETHQDLRAAVRDLCRSFPDAYWRELDARRAYPEAFVKALTDAGYLAALIPEEFGGSGLGMAEAAIIMEEINRAAPTRARAMRRCTRWARCCVMARRPETRDSSKIASGALRLRLSGQRADTGSDTTQMKTMALRKGDTYVVRGQKVGSRAEHSDLLCSSRARPVDQVKKRGEGLSIFLVDMRAAIGHGLTIRPIRTMMNHATTELFFDDLRSRRPRSSAKRARAFDCSTAQRRADPDRGRMHRRRPLVHRARDELRERPRRLWSPIGQNQGVQSRSRAHVTSRPRPDAHQGRDALRSRQALRRRSQHGKLLAADASWEAANVAVQTYGGFGFAEDYDIERKFRNEALPGRAISTNLILAFVGEHVLGLPRSY